MNNKTSKKDILELTFDYFIALGRELERGLTTREEVEREKKEMSTKIVRAFNL